MLDRPFGLVQFGLGIGSCQLGLGGGLDSGLGDWVRVQDKPKWAKKGSNTIITIKGK